MVPILLDYCAVTFIPLNEASHHKVLSAKQESYLLGLISNQGILLRSISLYLLLLA
jgi:hypothetical protein